jgi:hypothetical protein
MMITVVDVIKKMGIDPKPELTWSVGDLARDLWEAQFGQLPPKELRPKTAGDGGSHCFAVYPASWEPIIMVIIRRHKTEKDRQGELFET